MKSIFNKITFLYIFFSFGIATYSQTIKMRIESENNEEIEKQNIEEANRILEHKIAPSFTDFLKELDNKAYKCLEKDFIDIVFMVDEFSFKGVQFNINTDTLLFQKISLTNEAYEDTKAIFLAQAFKVHLAKYIWNYPNMITTRKMRDYYYFHYFLPKSKELFFAYNDANAELNPYLPNLKLDEAKYLELVIPKMSKLRKKKAVINNNFISINFEECSYGFYQFDKIFLDYMIPEMKIKDLMNHN